MTAVLVRPAAVEDARAIAAVHVRSWQATYRGVVPDAFLDALSVEDRAGMWRGWMSGPTDVRVWVAEESGRVVGFVAAGSQHPSEQDDVAEVHAIYVEPWRTGHGLGRELLDRAVGELRPGYGAVILWVLEANDGARRFYEAADWRLDGGRKVEQLGGADLPQVRYRLEL